MSALAMKRVLHITVFCLNYFYLGRFPSQEELGRRPSANQLECFARLRSLLVVCGADGGAYPTVPGRSDPELGAAIFQLERFLEGSHELNQSYVQHKSRRFAENKGLFPEEKYPQ